jgi:hypothetical protein
MIALVPKGPQFTPNKLIDKSAIARSHIDLPQGLTGNLCEGCRRAFCGTIEH